MTEESGEAVGARVLVVDDEESMRHSVSRALKRAGHVVRSVEDAEQALQALALEPAEVVVTDVRMPGLDGHELFARIAQEHPESRVILMTGHGSIAAAVQAMREGAESYLAKPFERDELLVTVARAAERARLLRENDRLRRRVARGGDGPRLLGESDGIQRLLETIERVAPRDGVVLVSGESGVGKEVVARAIHRASARADGPFVTMHCGALPSGLLEAELFGVEAGAFTGAEVSRAGYAERADGGTLFLDAIADIPAEAQVSLLRLLQEGEVVRIGGSEVRHPNVRILAATSRDLREEVAAGRFREDLWYRLNVLPVQVPALRTRREDLPVLVTHFLAEFGRPELAFDEAALLALGGYGWPGNVRELRNLVERVACTLEGPRVTATDLPAEFHGAEPTPLAPRPYRQALEDFERGYLEDLLRRARGNISEASRLGGVPRPTLHARLRNLGVDAQEFR